MKTATTLTAAALALVLFAPSAFAQRMGGGGTIGCDPGLPSHQVSATQCRLFHKEALYGPSANPYAAYWDQPVIVKKKVVKKKKTTRSKSGAAY